MSSTPKLTAVLVDDEQLARENLRMLLEDFCPEIEVIGTAGGVREALEVIRQKQPQVVFLDIRMPSGAEGFDLLDQLPDKNFQVVFVTAFKDYAIQALNANAIHYLLKPIDIEDLQNAVAKLVEYQGAFKESESNLNTYLQSVAELTRTMQNPTQPTRLTLYHSKGFKIVPVDEIIRLEADGGCTAFYFADGTRYLDTKNLKTYEDLLDPAKFLRIHKSYMINLQYLREYSSHDGHFAIMSDRSSVPVARARLSEFLSATGRMK
ncbi:MAG: response regulator transcription factor [Flavobacteriales bacterium]|nr:response regulator transcription factor [Flavobacteriales bacterium]